MTRRVSDMTPEQHAQHLATRKRYRLANPEKIRAARVLYRKTHPDKVRESRRRQMERQQILRPEVSRAKRKRYRKRYREKVLAERARDRERMPDWYIRQQLHMQEAPQELLEVKRAHLKLRRQLRTMK
jgi:hypothetical protein